MLDGRDLRIIVTIAEHGSLVRAGRVLGMSQPSLTRSLAQIEEKLGAALFDRSRRGMAPTDTGRAILAQGHEIVARLDALAATVEALRGTQMQTLTIASAVMPLDSVVLPAVADSLDGARGTRFQVLATDFAEAIRLVEDRRADLAVAEIAELPALGLVEVVPLRRHAVQHWVRPGHPLLALGRRARVEELLRYPLSVGTSLAGRYAARLGQFPEAADSFHAVMGSTLHVSLSLAAQSDACAIAPAASARLFHMAGQLHPLLCEVEWPATNFGIIWLKRRLLDATAKALIERMKAADEAAFRYAQSLPPAFLPLEPAGYAVAGPRHAPASPSSPAGE
jgi:DNA-binding transcriptional LysR family regulator